MSYYFDYAAATPMSPKVKKAMEPYLSDQFYNPSAQYLAAQNVHKAIETARAQVASVLGARSQEIIITAGGTEANNLAIRGVMENYPGANCIVSAVEHDAILEPAANYTCKIAPVHQNGLIDLGELEKLIDDKTVLISVMYANNEIGTVQPISEISKLIKKARAKRSSSPLTTRLKIQPTTLSSLHSPLSFPLFLHTDACQAPNYLHILANTLGVDMMTLNGGKIYGPKQSGVLFVKTGIELEPVIYGGGQEKNIRSGTENVAGIIGFATALTDASTKREAELIGMEQMQKDGYKLIDKYLPQAIVNGSRAHRLPNNLHITLPGQDNERLMMELDERGFMVAVGSACSASSDEPSHVLKAIGLSDDEARSSLRISMGRETTADDLRSLILEIAKLTR